jgi:EAL domain-containing protein (putative c-di-GMP-specific phosphodiesterase class I)
VEIHEGMLILQVPAAAWTQHPRQLLPLLDACERVHCHVMLDDFELKEAGLELLRHKAIRMLKFRAELTTAAMDDRYSRALLSSCLQIARVLGIHCVAKKVVGAAATRWLANAGIDYIDPSSASETAGSTTTGDRLSLRQVS